MTRLLFFCLLAIPARAFCQEIVFLPDRETLLFGSCSTACRETVDTALWVVRYDYLLRGDTTPKECAVLQIGHEYTRFYGRNRWSADSVYTAVYNDPSYTYDRARAADTPAKRLLPFEIIRNRHRHRVWTYHRVPFRHDRLIERSEKEEPPSCEPTQRMRMIGGYACFHARIATGGRVWDAWFAPEIPIDAGPWKLRGLPGLILEAADTTGSYRFSFQSLQSRREPITIPRQKTTVMDKKRWLQYEKRIHENPRSLLPQATICSYDADHDAIIGLDASWTIPYNPIELE